MDGRSYAVRMAESRSRVFDESKVKRDLSGKFSTIAQQRVDAANARGEQAAKGYLAALADIESRERQRMAAAQSKNPEVEARRQRRLQDQAARDKQKLADIGRITGSATIVREELSGDDPVSREKRLAAEEAWGSIAQQARLEGVTMSQDLSEQDVFNLARRAGLDVNKASTIHAVILNSAGGREMGTALSGALKAQQADEKRRAAQDKAEAAKADRERKAAEREAKRKANASRSRLA